MKSLSLGSKTVKYVEVGSGEPMLFLHNGGSGHWIWHYQIQHFARKYRVLAFDMLGCGASDRPDVTYDLNFYTQMTDEIITQLNLQNPILVGNCVGAAVALEYASLNSSRLKALILFNLCGGHHMMTPLVRWASLPPPDFLEPVHWAMLKMFEHTPGVIKSIVRINYAAQPDPTDPVFLAESKGASNPAQTQSRLNLMKGLSSFNKFSHDFIRPAHLPPTVVFWGQKNRVLSLSNGLRFCERLQPTRTHIVENAGHLLMAEKPDYVNLQIENFLSNLIGHDTARASA
jgi:pimeloyl-ACP methyl ester carboxylesterase